MNASNPSSPGPSTSPSSGSNLPRRGTASSVTSDLYKPLPVGHWLLKFHGSCPRCHHQHHAVDVKVDVSHDARKSSKIQCDKCHQNWLALGGSNSTQISLLSTLTTIPDPVESEVRSALISMVKSATAIASPVLSDIPEVPPNSRPEEYITPPRTGNIHQPLSGPYATSSQRALLHNPATRAGDDDSSSSNATSRSSRRFSPLLVTSIKQLFRSSKGQKLSAKAQGKLPIRDPVSEAKEASAVHAPGSSSGRTLPEGKGATTPQVPLPIDGPSIRSEEAARFLAGIDTEPLNTMDKEALFIWMRNKLTSFESRRAAHSESTTAPAADTGTTPEADPLHIPSNLPLSRGSREIFGIGSLFNHLDEWWASGDARRPRSIAISERASEATTIVNDETTVGSGLRSSGQGFIRGDRRGSGSPRPSSVNRVRRSWQQHHQPRADTRLSIDSTITAGDLSGVRGNSNRWSRGSIGRTSIVGYSEMRSQSSLYLTLNEVDDTENSNRDSLSPTQPRGNDT